MFKYLLILVMLAVAGAPALAAAAGAQEALDLGGTWADPRTGSDFFEIQGTAQALTFSAYGGSPANPRYLTRGEAKASEPGQLIGHGQDAPGFCCGNQGRLELKVLSPQRMQVRAAWWPLGQPDPGEDLGEPYVLERTAAAKAIAAPAPAPVVTPPSNGHGNEPAPAQPALANLLRLYHPQRQLHAYAVDNNQTAGLTAQGFQVEGPVGQIMTLAQAGAVPLYAFRHRELGYTLLSRDKAAPPGCEPLGALGHVWPTPRPQSQPLHLLKGVFAEPLRGGPPRQDVLCTTRPETVAAATQAGYGPPEVLGHIQPAQEPAPRLPVGYAWTGFWQGDGWGRFYLLQKGRDLFMYWYYAGQSSPRFFGHYQLSPDLRRAQGAALGPPGREATYFRHELTIDLDHPQGPRLQMRSWRLAAPLDDGRLVSFLKPKESVTWLAKDSPLLSEEAEKSLTAFSQDPNRDPAQVLDNALAKARQAGRLLRR